MARYKLMSRYSWQSWKSEEKEEEVGGQRKTTKDEIEKWIEDNGKPSGGIEWRVGYAVKFYDCDLVYVWRWIKGGKHVDMAR